MSDKILKNIKEIISNYLNKSLNEDDVIIERLTAPGDNYLSLMLKVDVCGGLSYVAKCISDNDFAKDGYGKTFKNEVYFYKNIVPVLREFSKGKVELDIFPTFIGANEEVDENSVIVLENLKTSGYKIQDRMRGFDLDSATIILKDLAKFHAIPLALKLKKPQIFETVIKSNANFTFDLPENFNPFLNGISVVHQIILNDPDLNSIADKIRSGLIEYSSNLNGRMEMVKEPFGTLSHFDMWVNNTMQKFENGRVFRNKFVDFQMYLYESPLNDFTFFVLSSVNKTVLAQNFDLLFEVYHEQFVLILGKLQCDVAMFSKNEFLNELNRVASFEMYHVLLMAFVLFVDKKTIKPNTLPGSEGTIEHFPLEIRDRLNFIVKFCIKRGFVKF